MGKFWQTLHIKIISKENFGKYSKVIKYTKYSFAISVNIDEENLGE